MQLFHKNLSAQNVALEIFPSDLAWHVQAARNRTENCFTNAQIGPPVQAWGGATGCFRGRGETEGGGKLQQLEKARPIDPHGPRPLIAYVFRVGPEIFSGNFGGLNRLI